MKCISTLQLVEDGLACFRGSVPSGVSLLEVPDADDDACREVPLKFLT